MVHHRGKFTDNLGKDLISAGIKNHSSIDSIGEWDNQIKVSFNRGVNGTIATDSLPSKTANSLQASGYFTVLGEGDNSLEKTISLEKINLDVNNNSKKWAFKPFMIDDLELCHTGATSMGTQKHFALINKPYYLLSDVEAFNAEGESVGEISGKDILLNKDEVITSMKIYYFEAEDRKISFDVLIGIGL